jgi:hypothetical protein
MAVTIGYVATLEVETRNVSRIWFALTAASTGSNWVRIGQHRAWFTMSMETKDRPSEMSKLSLLTEAMRNGLHVRVSHGGAADFKKYHPHDSFEVNGVEVLRQGLTF